MPDYLFPFEKLDVWKMAVDLAEYVLDQLEKLPQNKHIRLIGQMEAAAVSVPQNIAEGKKGNIRKNSSNFFILPKDQCTKL